MLRVDNISVSIHPPRMGRDSINPAVTILEQHFNPPSPCGEGLSGWRGNWNWTTCFNPPSPCGEGRSSAHPSLMGICFNPPSPCGEGHYHLCPSRVQPNFNPPSPCGEGRLQHHADNTPMPISIHPPRVGRDPLVCIASKCNVDFNPPSPCGEGHFSP